MPEPFDDPSAGNGARAERLARIALIIACVAVALAILGLFMPI